MMSMLDEYLWRMTIMIALLEFFSLDGVPGRGKVMSSVWTLVLTTS